MNLQLHACALVCALGISFGGMQSVVAQTPISGSIASDTTLSIAGSPYLVTGTVTVEGGAILTIDPGVVVEFAAGTGLEVGSVTPGMLVARGLPGARICFAGQGGGSWGALAFRDAAVDGVLDAGGGYVSGSVLEHCEIREGGNPGPSMVLLENSSPVVQDCELASSSACDALSVEHADLATPPLRLSRCLVTAGSVGVLLASGQDHHIADCLFDDNIQHIRADGGASLTVERCEMTGFAADALRSTVPTVLRDCRVEFALCFGFVLLGGSAGHLVERCEVLGTGDNAMIVSGSGPVVLRQTRLVGTSGYGLVQSGSDLIAEDCVFVDNSDSGLKVTGFDTLVVRRSLLAGNDVGFEGGGAFLVGNPGSSALFERCDFVDNFGGDAGGIAATDVDLVLDRCRLLENESFSDGGGISLSGGSLVARWSVLADNVASQRGGGLYLNDAFADLAGDPVLGSSNTFLGNTASVGDAIYNDNAFDPAGLGIVVATSVCWGTQSPAAIAQRVHDQIDDPALAPVLTFGPVACNPSADLGRGSSGVNGPTTMRVGGPLSAGSTITLTIEDAPPNAPGILLASPTPAYQRLPGTNLTLVPGLAAAQLPILADSAGDLVLGGMLGTVVPGQPIYLQSVFLGGSDLNPFFSLSNAVLLLP